LLIAEALEAAQFKPGESFQLARINDGRIVCQTFTVGDDVSSFLAPAGNYYLTCNPVRPDLGARRASEADVVEERLLLFDVDPTGVDREPARLVAEAARAWLTEQGYRPPMIDSGRGFQLWIHCPGVDKPRRRALILGLGLKFSADGAKVDSTADACRLMRLPGTVNLKTGRKAVIL